MNAHTILRFLFGSRTAIEKVARSRAGFWTGMILVLLTAFPRNYDQNHISENTILWLFGPLLFSIVSGTWMFLIVYQLGTSRGRKRAEQVDIGERHEWRSFMGMFWMTAPIAWVYALPVEGWFDSVTAAKANVGLLALVSAWRVLLLSRCIQVACRYAFFKAFTWVMAAAAVEVFVVGLFGGIISRAILASMGGLRNSPAEEVVFEAVSTAMGLSMWIAPIALVVGLAWGWRGTATSLPMRVPGDIPWAAVFVCGVVWLLVSVGPQSHLAANVGYERELNDYGPRAAIDYLNAHNHTDFAASRPLPPKPFERGVFRELPEFVGQLRAGDASWVREYFIGQLDLALLHYRPRRTTESDWQVMVPPDRRSSIKRHWERNGPGPAELAQLLSGLREFPEGQSWIDRNEDVVAVWEVAARAAETMNENRWGKADQQAAGWVQVKEIIRELRGETVPDE